ncbi:MAG: DUF4105 domain-containing protein [Hyphomonas sp.]|jgi:hypothetical protein|nr:DUF4105 domain-containing protein [Hyphomonas sp.]
MALAAVAAVVWWVSRVPSNDRNWQADVARVAWAERDGDTVRLHNVRNFHYRTETDFDARWEDRTVNLSELKGVDLFVSHWGSPWIAHALVSFDFGPGGYLTASVEARKEVGESYSAVWGFFRQYERIFILADERDVIRLRTNIRTDEEVRLYRTRLTRADSEALFRQYLDWMNSARQSPEWYNALTANCTSSFTDFLVARGIGGVSRWDWRLVANGKGEEMLYELGNFEAGGLGFAELQEKSLINGRAVAAGDGADFSRRIREGLPGF